MFLVTGRKPGYAFLDDFEQIDTAPHTTAPWLLSDFAENHWFLQTTQKNPTSLNWSVPLWDGSLLTDDQHDVLLRSLKHLLIIGANGVNDEFATLALASQDMRLKSAMKFIDYLLINAKDLDLILFGLGALSGDDLKALLNQFASAPRFEESIYQWRSRASEFCLAELDTLKKSEERAIYAQYPSILDLCFEEFEDIWLDVDARDIPRIRAAMMKAGLYYGSDHYGWRVNTKAISARLYPGTLWGGQTHKSPLSELTFYPDEQFYKREYPAVKVTTGKSGVLQSSQYFYYRYTLLGSAALSKLGLPCPSEMEIIANYVPDVKEASRFRSVPSSNLLKLFRKSMELHVEHGRKILDGFVSVATFCHTRGIPMTALHGAKFLEVIGPELVTLGVKRLGLSSRQRTRGRNHRRKGSPEKYFTNLRANHGLIEMVYVYLGSIQMTVGILMARRVDELVSLDAQKCLDDSKSWLVFNLAKSTRKALGLRQRESRPIDAIAVEMIEELRRFQDKLKISGVIDNLTDLFSSPSPMGYRGLQKCSLHVYNRHLNFACDYFQSDLNEKGERYYVRQHQLRRFFAIMFFYTNSYGELDTLRWMLGHRDIEHIWHYLTECLDPRDIRGANARYFADLAKHDRLENYENLRDLLSARFGTTSFHLVDEQNVENYIESMFEEGKAHTRTEFFHDENGKSMKILFIVS